MTVMKSLSYRLMPRRSLATSIVYSSMYLILYDFGTCFHECLDVTVAVSTKMEPKVLHSKHTHVLSIPLQHSEECWYFKVRAFRVRALERPENLHTARHAWPEDNAKGSLPRTPSAHSEEDIVPADMLRPLISTSSLLQGFKPYLTLSTASPTYCKENWIYKLIATSTWI